MIEVPKQLRITKENSTNNSDATVAASRSGIGKKTESATSTTKLQSKTSRNFSKNQEIHFESEEVPSVICLSHREDVDGLTSAALLKSAFKDCYVILLDYANLIRHLKRLSFLMSDSSREVGIRSGSRGAEGLGAAVSSSSSSSSSER